MEKTLKKLSSETLSLGLGAPFPWDNYIIDLGGRNVNRNLKKIVRQNNQKMGV